MDSRSLRSTPPADSWVFDVAASRAVDRAAVERYGLPGIVLMENASRGATEIALAMLAEGHRHSVRRIVLACGPGNNGGDGYVMARHLRNSGCEVDVVALGVPAAESDAGINRMVASRMGIAIHEPCRMNLLVKADLVIDALFGTGLDRALSGDAAMLVDGVNRCGQRVLAIDLPSGLDGDTGQPLGPTVRASRTVTFLGWKRGFLNSRSREWTGDVTIVDIGAPRELLAEFGRSAGSFASSASD